MPPVAAGFLLTASARRLRAHKNRPPVWPGTKKMYICRQFTKQPNNSEDMPPKVSVIVPNYNYARYLKARIDSILNQTFQDFSSSTHRTPEAPSRNGSGG